MALSNEWEEVHLTPNGWVDGSYKHDCRARVVIDVPQDALLTVRRHVVVGAIGASPDIDVSETALSTDAALIAKLREKHGKPVFGC